MNSPKRTRPNHNGGSSCSQTKTAPRLLGEAIQRFKNALDLVDEELQESFDWCQSDNERIRILSVRQYVTKLREAGCELVKAKGGDSRSKECHEVLNAGHLTSRNTWLKIGLSPVEIAAARKIQGWWSSFDGKITASEVIRALVVYSLAHYNAIEPRFFCEGEYARAEGFTGTEHYREELIKKAFLLRRVQEDHWE